MKYHVTVRPNAKENRIAEKAPGEFAVWVKAPAREGKANEAVCRLVAEHLGVAPSRVRLVHGRLAKKKVIEIV